jgi:lysophospholipase L1-like esterase
MTQYQIPGTLATARDSGITNLIVSGCSFTHNPSDQHSVSWPQYLAARYAIPTVDNVALSGAGNSHINASVQWLLECNNYDRAHSLVVVMWSGNDRDDLIIDSSCLDPKYPVRFDYAAGVSAAITGGSSDRCRTNVQHSFRVVTDLKRPASRAVENYLYVNSLYNYLQNNSYRFVFLDYLDRSLPNRTLDVDITPYLSDQLAQRYRSRFAPVENIYAWCLQQDLLEPDDFHPSPDGHLAWTDRVLIPYLDSILYN